MRTIRHSVFETNSSSSHSISVSSNTKFKPDGRLVPQNGTVYINAGEFNWGIKSYNDAYTKASYCFTDQGPSEMLENVIRRGTGATKVVFGRQDDGYVDHQSVGTAAEAYESEEKLFNFIFNIQSTLLISNDNQ